MLLFDLDGTLVDSSGVWLQIDLDFTAKRGLPHTQEYHDFVAHTTAPTAAQFTKEYYGLSESAEEIMQEWSAQALYEYTHHIQAKPHVHAYLEQCQQQGARMAVVTSSAPELCRATLKKNGLSHYFERLLFAQEFGIEKQNPALFQAVAETLGVSCSTCLVYDDSPLACRGAKSAGMQVIGVYDPLFSSSEAEMRALCDRYIFDFSELLAV